MNFECRDKDIGYELHEAVCKDMNVSIVVMINVSPLPVYIPIVIALLARLLSSIIFS